MEEARLKLNQGLEDHILTSNCTALPRNILSIGCLPCCYVLFEKNVQYQIGIKVNLRSWPWVQ